MPSCETYYDMDGFIYQQVLSSEVSDLMNMSKEVYELHDDNTESLVDGIVNESSNYGIEVGFLDDLESKAMFLGINKGLGIPTTDGSELYAKQRLEELRLALRSESMSYGELLELQCLSPYIDKGDVELLEASGVEEFSLHQLQTNFVGRTTSAYEYVGELNDLVGRNAFSCSTKRVDQNPQTEWIISGKDITSEEIERLNLHLDFIID